MAEELKEGDVVKLKSGGPAMTLLHRNIEGIWVCAWFEGKKHVQGIFPDAALEKTEPPRAGVHVI